MIKRQISIPEKQKCYDIIIEKDSIKKANEYFNLDRKVFIITDSGVPKEYAKTISTMSKIPYIFTFEEGEKNKTFNTVTKILSEMLSKDFDRSDCIVAVGGGVVGDIAGFAASMYMRGIDFYNIPTTLLSQVDSSIGGKTAVNFEGIKNIIGAFYQPKALLIDTNLLKTLSKRQISNGYAEVVKMALTSDENLFNTLKNTDLLSLENIDKIIDKSLKIKGEIVIKDEKETGLRKILNFGHTIGHGIESQNEINGLYHGECVALGMVYMTSEEVKPELIKILKKLNLRTTLNFNKDLVFDAISHDKKTKDGFIDIIKVEKIGSYKIERIKIHEIKTILENYKGDKSE